MITNLQLKFLEDYYGRTDLTPKERKKYNVYMPRIQQTINKNFRNALKLAKKYPELLLNETGTTNKHKRLQNLLLLIKILKPELDVYIEIAKEVKKIL